MYYIIIICKTFCVIYKKYLNYTLYNQVNSENVPLNMHI